MTVNDRIPELIRPTVENYVSLTSKHLPGLIHAFYIVGSIALGEFNARASDIDFVAVLNHRVTPTEIEQLHSIHQFIEKNYPRWKMSGSYIQPGDIGKFGTDIEPPPHFHDGILHLDGHSDINLVTWWELKYHGIAVIGKPPQNLSFSIDWDLLKAEMKENLNSYWASWLKRPGRMIVLYSDWGIQWAVLGVLRQYFTFRQNSITTKVKAGEYALSCLPARWHPLIREAIEIRNGIKKSVYRSKLLRTIEAVRFLKYIIRKCNLVFKGTPVKDLQVSD